MQTEDFHNTVSSRNTDSAIDKVMYLVNLRSKQVRLRSKASSKEFVRITSTSTDRELISTKSERLLTSREKRRWKILYIVLWVYDIIITGEHNVINAIKSLLKNNFKMDGRGELHWFLGMRIIRTEDKITVDREKYTF